MLLKSFCYGKIFHRILPRHKTYVKEKEEKRKNKWVLIKIDFSLQQLQLLLQVFHRLFSGPICFPLILRFENKWLIKIAQTLYKRKTQIYWVTRQNNTLVFSPTIFFGGRRMGLNHKLWWNAHEANSSSTLSTTHTQINILKRIGTNNHLIFPVIFLGFQITSSTPNRDHPKEGLFHGKKEETHSKLKYEE